MSKIYTINTLLCLEKSLKSRLAQLISLSSECSKRVRWLESSKVDEPTYDIKKVDSKVARITKALFDIDMKVKETNAKTKVEMGETFDFDDLMLPLE